MISLKEYAFCMTIIGLQVLTSFRNVNCFTFTLFVKKFCLFTKIHITHVSKENIERERYILRRSDYIIGFIAPAIGQNKSKKLTQLIAPAHNIRGKV